MTFWWNMYYLTKMLQEYPRVSMEAELARARSEAAAAARRLELLEEEAARSAHHGHPAGPDRPPGDCISHRCPEIAAAIVDLTAVGGAHRDVLASGAGVLAQGCLTATRSMIFVARCSRSTARWTRSTRQRRAGGAEEGLARRGPGCARGHNHRFARAEQPGRGLSPAGSPFAATRARTCRSWGRAWFVRHPLLLGAAARFADLTSSLEAAALRDMQGLCASEGACRRAGLLRSLGDARAALARPQGWPCCDVCDPDGCGPQRGALGRPHGGRCCSADGGCCGDAGRAPRLVRFALLETGAWRQECGGHHQPHGCEGLRRALGGRPLVEVVVQRPPSIVARISAAPSTSHSATVTSGGRCSRTEYTAFWHAFWRASQCFYMAA